jgi:hypothetical protein
VSLGHGWDNKPIIETVISNSSCTTTLNKTRHDSCYACGWGREGGGGIDGTDKSDR